jgi:hypothetical protein
LSNSTKRLLKYLHTININHTFVTQQQLSEIIISACWEDVVKMGRGLGPTEPYLVTACTHEYTFAARVTNEQFTDFTPPRIWQDNDGFLIFLRVFLLDVGCAATIRRDRGYREINMVYVLW